MTTTTAPPPALAADNKIIVRDDAQPPEGFFDDLLETEPKFAASWHRNRPDFRDQSSQSYQLSLAAIAMTYSWTDQEIADLIIAWRRRHGRDFHHRSNYYYPILNSARSSQQQQEIHKELPRLLGQPPDRVRPQLLAHLSQMLRIRVSKVLRYAGPPEVYALHTDHGAVRLGPTANWESQSDFSQTVLNATGKMPRACLEVHWKLRRQAIRHAAEGTTATPPAQPADQLIAWLDAYLREYPPNHNWASAIADAQPLVKDGSVHIFSRRLRDWLYGRDDVRLTPHQMGQKLRKIGAKPRALHEPQPGVVSRQYWRLPDRDFPAPLPPAFSDTE